MTWRAQGRHTGLFHVWPAGFVRDGPQETTALTMAARLVPQARVQEIVNSMYPGRRLDIHLTRPRQVTRALWLATVSVAFGLASGAVSVITGLHDHSLGVLAVGLGVLADVTGSVALIWRFRAERHRHGRSAAYEWRAAVIVAVALAVVAVALTAESVSALVSGSRPGTSAITLIAASVSLAVLTPLAWAKRRLGGQMGSRALQGDGTLSGIGAATSLLALAALALK